MCYSGISQNCDIFACIIYNILFIWIMHLRSQFEQLMWLKHIWIRVIVFSTMNKHRNYLVPFSWDVTPTIHSSLNTNLLASLFIDKLFYHNSYERLYDTQSTRKFPRDEEKIQFQKHISGDTTSILSRSPDKEKAKTADCPFEKLHIITCF